MKPLLFAAGMFIFALSPVAADDVKDKKDAKDAPKEWSGKLQTGVFAIGGETTGIVLSTKAGAFELDLGKNKELRAKAEKLNGKQVTVTGSLTIRKGVEIKQRRIITVTSIKEADAK